TIPATIYGGSANDVLKGGAGNDRLYGDAGDDWLEAGSAAEFADGGYGTDWNAHVWAVGGATRDDIRQDGSGTCVFLSSLAASAPAVDLSTRITYAGNFTYNVQFC